MSDPLTFVLTLNVWYLLDVYHPAQKRLKSAKCLPTSKSLPSAKGLPTAKSVAFNSVFVIDKHLTGKNLSNMTDVIFK